MDEVQFYYRKDHEYGTDKYRAKTRTVGFGTPEDFSSQDFTGIDGKQGKPKKYSASIEFTTGKETFQVKGEPGGKHFKLTMFKLGGRF